MVCRVADVRMERLKAGANFGMQDERNVFGRGLVCWGCLCFSVIFTFDRASVREIRLYGAILVFSSC